MNTIELPPTRSIKQKNPRKLHPKRQAILEIMLAHGDADGKLDYNDLNLKVPDWARTFPSAKWITKACLSLKKTGRFQFEKERRANGVTASPANGLTEDEQTIIAIYRQYSENGMVRWAKAMKEHPEWTKIICYPKHVDTRNATRASQMLMELRKRGKLDATRTPALNGNHAVAMPLTDEQKEALIEKRITQAAMGIVNEMVPFILKGVGFCCECGHDHREKIREVVMSAKTRA